MFDKKKMDLENLDALISKCEDSMVSPFKKKKAEVAVEVAPEDSGDEGEDDKPDMSDMDLEDLVKMYQELKEAKGE